MLTQIDHLVIATGDLEKSQQECVALLGRSPSWSGEHPTFGTRNVIFRLANTYIELLAPSGEGPVSGMLSAHMEEYGPGLFALALATDDAAAAVTTMRERGLSPSDPVEGLRVARRRRGPAGSQGVQAARRCTPTAGPGRT